MPRRHGFRPSLLARLVRRPRWLAALGLGALGWPLQALALLFAPLTLVQPALGLGLVVLLGLAVRLLGERVGRHELAGVAAIVAGVGGLAVAAPERAEAHAGAPALAAALAVLGALALAPYLVRSRDHRVAGLAASVSAGFAFALSGLTTKLLADSLSLRAWLSLVLWAALTGLAAGVGVLSEMTALQRRPVAQVAPVVFAVETVLPVLLAPLLVAERWGSTPLGGGVLLLSLAAVVAGGVVLEASPALVRLLERSATSTESGTAESRASASRSSRLASD